MPHPVPDEHGHGGKIRSGGCGDFKPEGSSGHSGTSPFVHIHGNFPVREGTDDLQDFHRIQHRHALLLHGTGHGNPQTLFKVEGGNPAQVIAVGIVFAEFRVGRTLEQQSVHGGKGILRLGDSRRRCNGGKKLLSIKNSFHK